MNLDRGELLSQLRQMDEYEFEHLIADVWDERGWEATVTSGSNDRGIDVIAQKSSPFSQKHLIQAKRHSAGNKIGSPDIQQYSSLRHQESGVDAIIVVTTSSFSNQAQKTADDLNVKLINGDNLCDIILNLSSQKFLSNYFNTKTKATNSASNTRRRSDSLNTSLNASIEESTTIPDRFDKDEKTKLLGRLCPICGEENSIWKGKTVNIDPMLVCENCGTKWSKKEKSSGIIFGSSWVEWSAIGKGIQKKTSEWRESSL